MGWSGRVSGSAHSKVGVTDSLGLKSLHGDLVHRGEVGLDHVNTSLVSLDNRFFALTTNKVKIRGVNKIWHSLSYTVKPGLAPFQ